ncbi:hypothetical protein V9T40_011683 [Parthenolecanium corni]|uniref:GOST seven transmembrane domain-containing protein n=1 Tax=Parthenolecanium corni TaxID=536013 RepID=A0AAN9TJ60_9HEMI
MFFLCSISFVLIEARIHQLKIEDDNRRYIRLMSFGFYEHGFLQINFTNFTYTVSPTTDLPTTLFGFTLEKMQNSAVDPHMKPYREKCLLDDESNLMQLNDNITFFVLDFKNKLVRVNCSEQSGMANLYFYKDMPVIKSPNNGLPTDETSQNSQNYVDVPKGESCSRNFTLPLESNSTTGYSTKLVMYVPGSNEEGLYKFFFHSCGNYPDPIVVSNFVADIEEFNENHNYLSAGEMLLPRLYYEMSLLFFPWAVIWIYTLCMSKHPVYKIHYLMAALIILKSLGLLFHGINYHYIGTKGKHVAMWATLYYIIHLLRGSVLFITIILIGTGWTFIKHFLSPKDKKIFMIVIPLQVFANIAEIIIDESEEGDAEHKIWLDVFTFVDLICCFAILFPIVWSIKHLQDASQTDGKAAINLKKLKLFRHFYVLIVCYIYFTRIIVYLLKMTVPFKYEWLDKFFKEIATLVFFILTGYKFRPASDNPYLHVPREEDEDMDVVISKCGLTEGLTKLSRINNEYGDDDKDSLLIYKRESSYDYD